MPAMAIKAEMIVFSSIIGILDVLGQRRVEVGGVHGEGIDPQRRVGADGEVSEIVHVVHHIGCIFRLGVATLAVEEVFI